ELKEEIGEQADEVLRRVDDKFYQATPHKIEMAADFVLNIATGVVTFIVGRTLYSGLTAALGALMTLLGFVPGWIASLGVAGFIWPIAIAGAITLSLDRKSTRLNSSHVKISYAVFCLKKKNTH